MLLGEGAPHLGRAQGPALGETDLDSSRSCVSLAKWMKYRTGWAFFTSDHPIQIIILDMSWIQSGRLLVQSEVDRSTAIPPYHPPPFPRVWVGGFLGKFLLSIITSKIFELESCATSQIVDLEKFFWRKTKNYVSDEHEWNKNVTLPDLTWKW